jgi:hypothetical protein
LIKKRKKFLKMKMIWINYFFEYLFNFDYVAMMIWYNNYSDDK